MEPDSHGCLNELVQSQMKTPMPVENYAPERQFFPKVGQCFMEAHTIAEHPPNLSSFEHSYHTKEFTNQGGRSELFCVRSTHLTGNNKNQHF